MTTSRSVQTFEMAQRLRHIRQGLRIPQAIAAKALLVSRASMCSLENGHRKVGALELAVLAQLYKHPMEYFVTGRHQTPPTLPALGMADDDAAD